MAIDCFMVVSENDLTLLRHFLVSYKLFYKCGGDLHIFLWSKDALHVDRDSLPENSHIWHKDDISELGNDDFKNQMYLKLHADKYTKTKYIWIPDADFILTDYLHTMDLCPDGRPNWYYKKWDVVSELNWRKSTESVLNDNIRYQFMDEPLYVLDKEVLMDLRSKVNHSNLIKSKVSWSEYVLYGAFAYKYHHDAYNWIYTESGSDQCSIVERVNQKPPSYMQLDENIKFNPNSRKKIHVFWSHWDKAEFKIIEFLRNAQVNRLKKIVVEPDERKIYKETRVEQLLSDGLVSVNACYSDGWAKFRTDFIVLSEYAGNIVIALKIPTDILPNEFQCHINDVVYNHKIDSPNYRLVIPILGLQIENKISICFIKGAKELKYGRDLYALYTNLYFEKLYV